jgi:acetyl-CoA carboxylase carboxyl transferase subunit alpha
MEYLSFELPIKELMDQYQTCSLVGEESGVDVKLACSQIEDKILKRKRNLWKSYTLAKSTTVPSPGSSLYIGLYQRNGRQRQFLRTSWRQKFR